MSKQYIPAATLADVLEDLDKKGIYGDARTRAVNGYLSLKARQHDIPINGSFELTPLCNLDCKMCYVHLRPEQFKENERLLTVDEWKDIMRQAAEAGMMYATLTGGECLTYPGFKELYRYLVTLGIRISVLTNGILLTDEIISLFTHYPPVVIQITVYGSNEDAYEKVCGHRMYQKVMDGIDRARSAGLDLHLTLMPSRYTQDDYQSLLDLLHQRGVRYSIGDGTLPARPETGRKIQDYIISPDTRNAIMAAEGAYHASFTQQNTQKNHLSYVPEAYHTPFGLPCSAGHNSFHVNWKGEICPCISFSAGVHLDILRTGFSSGWRCIRKTMQQYQIPSECKNCDIKAHCYACPGEIQSGILNGPLNKDVCHRVKMRYDALQTDSQK